MARRNPHDLAPFVVTASDMVPTGTQVGAGFVASTLADLLAEVGPRTAPWLSTVYARLCVASTGPLLVSSEGTAAARLERARWLRVNPDADYVGARRHAWPALDTLRNLNLGIGSPAPELVIVGEKDPYDRQPMFARCGVWLWRALRLLGWDELGCYVANAFTSEDSPQTTKLQVMHETFQQYEPLWVALGAEASEVLTNARIEHVKAHHPAWHRRYKFKDGPEGYGALLKEAGLVTGPYLGTGVPRYLDSSSLKLAEFLELPLSTGYRRAGTGNRIGIAKHKLEVARLAFVTGTFKKEDGTSVDIRTYRDLGKALGLKSGVLERAGREQGWDVERTKHLENVRERSKASAAEVEARRVAQARDLSWALATTMGAKLLKKIREDEKDFGARDFKAIVDAAITLSEKGDVNLEDEKKRLAGLSPQALLDEFKGALASWGVDDPAPGTPPANPPATGGGA